MSSFDERERAFEAKAAHDEEVKFKAQARTAKMIGAWAAEKMGKSGAAADTYAESVVVADLQEAGHQDVIRKVQADLSAAGVEQSDHQLNRTWDELHAQAIQAIKNG